MTIEFDSRRNKERRDTKDRRKIPCFIDKDRRDLIKNRRDKELNRRDKEAKIYKINKRKEFERHLNAQR